MCLLQKRVYKSQAAKQLDHKDVYEDVDIDSEEEEEEEVVEKEEEIDEIIEKHKQKIEELKIMEAELKREIELLRKQMQELEELQELQLNLPSSNYHNHSPHTSTE